AGAPYWYQVRWADISGGTHLEPAFRVLTDTPPVRARVRWIITHSGLDNDVFARFGSGTNPDGAPFVRPCGGSGAADSSVVAVPDPIGDRSVGEGLTLNFQAHASDPDGGAPTLGTSALPAGATFNAATGTFDWSPAFGQAGSVAVTFRATDMLGAADSERITI